MNIKPGVVLINWSYIKEKVTTFLQLHWAQLSERSLIECCDWDNQTYLSVLSEPLSGFQHQVNYLQNKSCRWQQSTQNCSLVKATGKVTLQFLYCSNKQTVQTQARKKNQKTNKLISLHNGENGGIFFIMNTKYVVLSAKLCLKVVC